MVVPGDGADEWIVAECAEIAGEALKIMLAHLLIGEGEDVVVKPCGADFGDGVRG
jgi:hypothetical protein